MDTYQFQPMGIRQIFFSAVRYYRENFLKLVGIAAPGTLIGGLAFQAIWIYGYAEIVGTASIGGSIAIHGNHCLSIFGCDSSWHIRDFAAFTGEINKRWGSVLAGFEFALSAAWGAHYFHAWVTRFFYARCWHWASGFHTGNRCLRLVLLGCAHRYS